MKYFFKIAIAIGLLIPFTSVHAQMTANSSSSAKIKNPDMQSQEYASKEKDKMIEYTNNEWGYLVGDFVCTNGDKVSEDGTLTKSDGTTKKLNDGDKVYRDGHMVSSGTASSKMSKSRK